MDDRTVTTTDDAIKEKLQTIREALNYMSYSWTSSGNMQDVPTTLANKALAALDGLRADIQEAVNISAMEGMGY